MKLSNEEKTDIKSLKKVGMSGRAIGRALRIPKSTVNDYLKALSDVAPVETPDKPKILLHDIETAPAVAMVWGRFKQNIQQAAVIKEGYTLSWAAQWYDEDKPDNTTMFDSLPNYHGYVPDSKHLGDDQGVVQTLWDLYDEADIIIGHNGDKFDIRKMNARFALYGLPSPKPYKTVDTLKIARTNFAFPSNRLDSLGEHLGFGRKEPTDFQLWVDCMAGDEVAWDRMVSYNINDIKLLRDVYEKLRGWDKKHPNVGMLYGDDLERCTVCGSPDLESTGFHSRTNVSEFETMVCGNCGHNNRRRANNRSKSAMKATLMNSG